MTTIANIFEAPAEKKPQSFDLDKLTQEFRQHRNTDWTIAEAFLCLLLAAASADGKVAVEEQAVIKALVLRSRAMQSVGNNGLAAANATVAKRLAERPNGLQEACESLPQDMRLPLFAHCVDIVLSDGDLVAVEADFLNRLSGFLGLDPNDAKRMMEALLIKNKF